MVPDTHFARTDDGLSIAYQTLGDGPRDIVLVPTVHSIDRMWDEPSFARVLNRLARLGRLICLDYRGFGSSDAVPTGTLPTPEAWMEDTRVVLDAVGSSSAHIVCHATASFIGILFAATYPERTATLTLVEASARFVSDSDYPAGRSDELVEAYNEWSQQHWGTGAVVSLWAPSRDGDAAFRQWAGRFERNAMSRAGYGPMIRWAASLDMRAVLPSVRVPTLVLHRESDPVIPIDHGRYLADHIPGASLQVLPGADLWFFTDGADDVVDHIEELVTGMRPVREADRALATVMFTDIVASTELAARLGDAEWTRILDQHDALVDRELDRHRGRKVNPTGDGVLATFDGPARAVRCALEICLEARHLGLDLRAGLHTGEVELRGQDIGGIAVHIGRRVSELAVAGEVLVSRTVKDLVTGSGLLFSDRGEHRLKGVPGVWTVFGADGRP